MSSVVFVPPQEAPVMNISGDDRRPRELHTYTSYSPEICRYYSCIYREIDTTVMKPVTHARHDDESIVRVGQAVAAMLLMLQLASERMHCT